jgi:hypothetical protein
MGETQKFVVMLGLRLRLWVKVVFWQNEPPISESFAEK